MIDPNHPRLSIQKQCKLVSISRSAFYYQPAAETPLNLELMKLLDQQLLETPWYGSRHPDANHGSFYQYPELLVATPPCFSTVEHHISEVKLRP